MQFKKKKFGLAVAPYTCNLGTQKAEAGDYRASLVYTESSRQAWATEREHVSQEKVS